MDHGDCPVVSSKPSDPQHRRPDGRMYFVETAEQLGSDDWQISDAVDWRHQRLGCSSRPGTSVPCFEGTGDGQTEHPYTTTSVLILILRWIFVDCYFLTVAVATHSIPYTAAGAAITRNMCHFHVVFGVQQTCPLTFFNWKLAHRALPARDIFTPIVEVSVFCFVFESTRSP